MAATRASNDRPPGAGGVKRGRLQQEAAASGSRVTVVLGAQWGDEGKGKVVDLLATDADIISRCQVRGPPLRPRGRPHDPDSGPGDGALPPRATPTRPHAHSAPSQVLTLPLLRGHPFPRDPAFPPTPTPTPADGAEL